MGRYFILLIFAAVAVTSCQSPQLKNRKNYVDSNIVANDTLFLRLEVKDSQIYQAVYVDPDKNSPAYLHAFDYSSTDSSDIKRYLTAIHKKSPTLKKFNIYGLATNWRPVYQYKSKYYLYDPSDGGDKAVNVLTDSLMMFYYFGDGYISIALQSVTKTNDRVFNMKLNHQLPDQDALPKELNIYIIDPKMGLAVWEFKTDGQPEYQLMVPKEHVKEYPIAINAHYLGMREEYDFEKINFKKLIAGVLINR
jgi:hypothetical protein